MYFLKDDKQMKRAEFDLKDLIFATVPGSDFDPRSKSFDLDELMPQPIIKKRRKVFIAEDLKDETYWYKRTKNNVAAKRSREARRIKENQIALRTSYLEKENYQLKEVYLQFMIVLLPKFT